jgi:peptidoglycan/xylan/chitin deacetylase (PgdA/CDA1 family)
MTEPEVSELNRSCLVEVAAHARTHRALTTLPLDQRWSEIEGSMQDCERLLGARPSDFAYPHGDHDSATVAMVERAGFSRACIADHGLTWPRTAPFRMPRFAVPDIGGEDFERKLLSDWLP